MRATEPWQTREATTPHQPPIPLFADASSARNVATSRVIAQTRKGSTLRGGGDTLEATLTSGDRTEVGNEDPHPHQWEEERYSTLTLVSNVSPYAHTLFLLFFLQIIFVVFVILLLLRDTVFCFITEVGVAHRR